MRWLCWRRWVEASDGGEVSRAPLRYLEMTAGEAARVDGLLEEAVAADGEARLAVALGGDGHDGDARELGLAAQAQGDLEAVEAGDVDVDEDEIGRLRHREAHALEAVGRVDHLVAGAVEQLADEEPVRRVVLDVEDLRHSDAIRARLGGARKGAASAVRRRGG